MAITLRLTPMQENEIEHLKYVLKMKSTSKTVLLAASSHLKLTSDLENSKLKISQLEYDLEEIKQSITNYQESKNAMEMYAL